VNLKPNGSEIEVTEKNKAEFVRLMTKWKGKKDERRERSLFLSLLPSFSFPLFLALSLSLSLYLSCLTSLCAVEQYRSRISKNALPFLRGLYRYISAKDLSIFNEGELELLICGLPTINVADWKANTSYQVRSAISVSLFPPRLSLWLLLSLFLFHSLGSSSSLLLFASWLSVFLLGLYAIGSTDCVVLEGGVDAARRRESALAEICDLFLAVPRETFSIPLSSSSLLLSLSFSFSLSLSFSPSVCFVCSFSLLSLPLSPFFPAFFQSPILSHSVYRSVPVGGFAKLPNARFTIAKLYESDRLPSAGTEKGEKRRTGGKERDKTKFVVELTLCLPSDLF
jgi:hypothetical protein